MVSPRAAQGGGELRDSVHRRAEACLDAVAIDVEASCQEAAEQASPDAGIARTLDELEAQKNIAVLEIVADDDSGWLWGLWGAGARSYWDIEDACQDLADALNDQLDDQGSAMRVAYRMPNASEAKLLAPFVYGSSVDWGIADQPHSIWYAPEAGSNPCGGAGTFPFFENDPEAAGSSFGCDDGDETRLTVCVPADGPLAW
jgi:hypothetical protein